MKKYFTSFFVALCCIGFLFAQAIPVTDESGNSYSLSSKGSFFSLTKTGSDGSSFVIWTGKEKASCVLVDKDNRLIILCVTGQLISMKSDGSEVRVISPHYVDASANVGADLSTVAYDTVPIKMTSGKFNDAGDIIVTAADGTYKLMKVYNYIVAVQ